MRALRSLRFCGFFCFCLLVRWSVAEKSFDSDLADGWRPVGSTAFPQTSIQPAYRVSYGPKIKQLADLFLHVYQLTYAWDYLAEQLRDLARKQCWEFDFLASTNVLPAFALVAE